MKVLIAFSAVLALAACGVIQHDSHGGHGHQATSYQDIQIEHFHAVPTYLKGGKEHQQLLDHPVSKGKTSAKVEVHHGDKHDLGYAITNIHSDLHEHAHDEHHFIAGGVQHSDEHHHSASHSVEEPHHDYNIHELAAAQQHYGRDDSAGATQENDDYSAGHYHQQGGYEGEEDASDASAQYDTSEGLGHYHH